MKTINVIKIISFIIDGNYGGLGFQSIKPGDSAEVIIRIGALYGKIYDKMERHDVYVHWGASIEMATETLEERTLKHTKLPRIGGMLTLPKGTILVDKKMNQNNPTQ